MAIPTLIFFPAEEKQMKQSGKFPIYLRIIVNRKKAEARLGIQLDGNELSLWDDHLMRVSIRNADANHLLNTIESNFKNFLILNSHRLPDFNAKQIRDHLLGNNDKQKSLTMCEFINHYYSKVIQPNSNLTKGTKNNYRKAIRHMERFLLVNRKKDFFIKEINKSFANDFFGYLISDDLKYERIGMSEVSASGIIKKFRTIFDRAIDDELLSSNSFKCIRLKNKSPRKPRLAIEQVNLIMKNENLLSEKLMTYKDLFLFALFTGLSYKDCMELTKDNLIACGNDEIKLSINRYKTDQLTEQYLTKYAIELISKYKNHKEVIIKSRIFPNRSNKELNAQLKIIAEKIGIPINLTFHIARHTFRQLLAESGIEDIGVIKRMMGQSRGGDVDEVYYQVTASRLLSAKQKFELYLESNLIVILT
jgi:integrase/recombinase XerD